MSSENDKVILYSYFRSSCSWRIRIALAFKGIDYEYRGIHLLKKEQVADDYLKVNPMGQVPALVIDGRTILQSIAILEYLEETRPSNPLLPKDVLERAKVREIVEMINAGIQPISNLGTMIRHSDDEAERLRWSQYWVIRGFGALEKILAESAGTYCVGDTLTLADVCLVPQVANAVRWKVDMSQFPIISRIDETLSKLEAFQVAHFSKQPDCPEELRT